MSQELDILRTYRNTLLFLLPVLLILSSFCGYYLSKRAMEPSGLGSAICLSVCLFLQRATKCDISPRLEISCWANWRRRSNA